MCDYVAPWRGRGWGLRRGTDPREGVRGCGRDEGTERAPVRTRWGGGLGRGRGEGCGVSVSRAWKRFQS